MNLTDDEEAPAAGKRKISEVEFPKPRSSSFRYLTSSSALETLGDVKAFTLDKFGALRDPEDERPHVYRCVQPITDSSTGSFTPGRVEGDKEGQDADVNDSSSTWSQYIDLDWKIEGTSDPGGSDPSSHSSVPISCTLHERRSTSGGPTLQELGALPQQSGVLGEKAPQSLDQSNECDTTAAVSTYVKELVGYTVPHVPKSLDPPTPPVIHWWPEFPSFEHSGPQQDEDNSHGEFELKFPQTEVEGVASELRNDSEPGVNAAAAAAAGSLPTALSRHSTDHWHRTTTSVLHLTNIDRPAATSDLAQARPPGRSASPSSQYNDLPRFTRNMESSSSEGARSSRQSTAQYPVRINYRFASASLEASLLQRMEARQRLQDEAGGEEPRVCGHVISPEDLIWGSVKHYCGMVLDRETQALLGTAILFMPPYQSEQQQTQGPQQQPLQLQGGGPGPGMSKAAWVTSVKVVEGRTEVLIKTSKGALHVAQLVLTSTTLGLALFSVHVWQATFALAFLSRVAGPARLPHRLFVDVNRNDRVYVTAYEEPWESESGTIADVRVRPGRIVDAGRHEIVEIDFTAGRLGGSINSPAGFRGGLVVRADGHLAGVVTGEVLGRHPTNIDFSSAYNVYSLLEEL